MSDFDSKIYKKAMLVLQMSNGSSVPDPDRERNALERVKGRFPELDIDPDEEYLILTFAQSMQSIGKPLKN